MKHKKCNLKKQVYKEKEKNNYKIMCVEEMNTYHATSFQEFLFLFFCCFDSTTKMKKIFFFGEAVPISFSGEFFKYYIDIRFKPFFFLQMSLNWLKNMFFRNFSNGTHAVKSLTSLFSKSMMPNTK